MIDVCVCGGGGRDGTTLRSAANAAGVGHWGHFGQCQVRRSHSLCMYAVVPQLLPMCDSMV
jgi:hypothetical protein